MDSNQEAPLDEIVWRSPQDIQEMGALHTNTILHYFARSPFFDATSNNANLFTQAMYNANMFYIIQTREAFEGRLRTMQGLEFMVIEDPSENDSKQNHSGVWVIRKQIRRKRQGQPDEILPIQCYFIVGENIYVAPSIESVLNCRLLSVVTSLTKMLSTASKLPDFTPSTGHSYITPQSKTPTPGSSLETTQNSEVATPMPATGTPRPDTQETSSTKASTARKADTFHDIQSAQLLETSYDLLLRYGNEYMDENPLVGEPGSFKLSKTRESGLGATSNTSQSASQPFKAAAVAVAPVKKAPPPQLQTDLPADPGKKTGGLASAKSPTSPSVKKKKERRKSRPAGSEDVTTPKMSTPQTAP